MVMSTQTTAARRSSLYLLSAPLVRLSNKLFGKPLASVASNSSVAAPSGRFYHPAAIHDPQELTRVTGTAETTSLANEMQRIQARLIEHGPSIGYMLKNVLLCDGVFYASGYRNMVSTKHGPLFNVGRAPWVQGGVLGQCWLGAKYFGHSLHEEMPMTMLASQRGRAVGIERTTTAQQQEYAQLFGTHLDYLPAVAWIDQIEILDDPHYNPSKVARWEAMRSAFAKHTNKQRHPGVVLLRGNTGQSRKLINEDEVVAYFSRLGFRAINPGLSNLRDVMDVVAGARIVVSMEGSQLVHGFLGIESTGALLVLQPPSRFDNAYKERCDVLGIKYSFVITHEAPGGFMVHMDQLDRALERIETSLSQNNSEAHWQ
jgi:hypothetical protein